MLYLILLVASASGVLWMQIKLFYSSLGKKKILSPIPHPDAFQHLIEKTGIPLENISLIESDKPFAMMMGFPGNPRMILSRYLYKTFSRDELEYVILHETAHYKYNHSLLELGIFVFSYVCCAGLFYFVQDAFIWPISLPVFAVLLIVSNIQFARLFERQADTYAAVHMHNPHGMISATHHFRSFYGNIPPEGSRRHWLFYRSTPYSERVTIAEAELKKRDG